MHTSKRNAGFQRGRVVQRFSGIGAENDKCSAEIISTEPLSEAGTRLRRIAAQSHELPNGD